MLLGLLNRLLSSFAIIVMLLYMTDEFYPFTRMKIVGELRLYHPFLTDWGNVFISLLISLMICGFFSFVWGIVGTTFLKIKSLVSRNEYHAYSDNGYISEGKNLIFLSGLWILFSLLFLKYQYLNEPVRFWIAFFSKVNSNIPYHDLGSFALTLLNALWTGIQIGMIVFIGTLVVLYLYEGRGKFGNIGKILYAKKLREWGFTSFQYSDNLHIKHGEMYKGELPIADENLTFCCTQCGKSKDIPNYGLKKPFKGHIKCPDCENDLFFYEEESSLETKKKRSNP